MLGDIFFPWGVATEVYSSQIGSSGWTKECIPPKSIWANQWFLLMSLTRNMGEGLLTGMEMTQKELLHQSPPQHKRQVTNVWEIEHLDQPLGSSTGRRVSFLGASVS